MESYVITGINRKIHVEPLRSLFGGIAAKLPRVRYYVMIFRDRCRNYACYSRCNNTFAVSLLDSSPINMFHKLTFRQLMNSIFLMKNWRSYFSIIFSDHDELTTKNDIERK